jgi:hypothetical protein
MSYYRQEDSEPAKSAEPGFLDNLKTTIKNPYFLPIALAAFSNNPGDTTRTLGVMEFMKGVKQQADLKEFGRRLFSSGGKFSQESISKAMEGLDIEPDVVLKSVAGWIKSQRGEPKTAYRRLESGDVVEDNRYPDEMDGGWMPGRLLNPPKRSAQKTKPILNDMDQLKYELVKSLPREQQIEWATRAGGDVKPLSPSQQIKQMELESLQKLPEKEREKYLLRKERDPYFQQALQIVMNSMEYFGQNIQTKIQKAEELAEELRENAGGDDYEERVYSPETGWGQ